MNCLNTCHLSPMKRDCTQASMNQELGKKPVYNCKRGALCPVCDGELYPKFLYVRRLKRQEIMIEEKTPYCKHCGHALDWGEEKRGHEMTKLNRDHIIKALECWASGNSCEGSCCPLFEISPDTCDRWMGRNALTLINELTQRLETLSQSYDHLEKTKNELLAERSRLSEGNERLMREKTALECVVSTARNQAKTDTVKKMQERLKQGCGRVKAEGQSVLVFTESAFDQIAKEMLEE